MHSLFSISALYLNILKSKRPIIFYVQVIFTLFYLQQNQLPFIHSRSAILATQNIVYICRLWLTKFYNCFRFFAPGMYDIKYLNMPH